VGLSIYSSVTVFLFGFFRDATAHSLPNGRGSVVILKEGARRADEGAVGSPCTRTKQKADDGTRSEATNRIYFL
jgi:hypothetical protein